MLTTPLQQVELFHLLFVRHLGEKIDKRHFVLKGGPNLRFYFKSIRYSENIDLDVHIVSKETLRTQVTKLLSSVQFQKTLAAHKQSETTQRWKLKIFGPASSLPTPTKIEFSRRELGHVVFEPVNSDIITKYNLYPVLCSHYDRASCLSQKISALAHRAQTQARDVFDLDLLLRNDSNDNLEVLPKGVIAKAIECLLSVSHSDYTSQVVAFLSTEYQDYFATETAWNSMQERVLAWLESLKMRAPL
jgi:predicted nucleotidyltransferase component of viral defense system